MDDKDIISYLLDKWIEWEDGYEPVEETLIEDGFSYHFLDEYFSMSKKEYEEIKERLEDKKW